MMEHLGIRSPIALNTPYGHLIQLDGVSGRFRARFYFGPADRLSYTPGSSARVAILASRAARFWGDGP